jgi:hypothetical protein
MKKLLSVFMLSAFFLLVFSGGVHAQAANVKGTWQMAVETSAGSGSPEFDLKQPNDTTIEGSYRGQLGESAVTGTLKGNKIYLVFSISGNNIEYEGVVEGDTMKGKVKLGTMAEGTFTGRRKNG